MQTLKLTKKYEKYPEYKDSGVEWLGKIPKGWESSKLRNVLRSNIVDGPHETPKYVDDGIPFISVDSIEDNEKVNLDVVKKFITDEQYAEYNKKTKLTKGDILFTKAASIGRVAIVDDRKFMTWSPLAIIKPNAKEIDFKYLYYVLKSNKFVESVVNNCSFNTQLNIGMKVLEKSIIAAPDSIEEQEKIVRYLDKKTSYIDQIVEKKEKQIELLREEIISIAQNEQENGKGELMNIGNLVNLYQDKIKIDDYTEYITLGLYNRGRGIFHKDTLLGKDIGDSDFLKVKPRDLIISGQFAWEGAVALASVHESDCVVSHRYHLLKDGVIKTEYLLALLMTKFGDHILNESSRGSAGRNRPLNIKILLKEKIRVPSKEAETKIKSLLIKMNSAQDNIKKSINLLEEYKSSLISNVVTGKIKI